jgi:Phage capsid family
MANEFSDLMTRTGSAAELPVQLAQDLVQSVIRDSTLLSLARKVPTTVLDSRIPVLSALPQAYWVVGDSGLKQTTGATFTNESILAQEIAAVCPIPQSILDDSQFMIWDAVKPLLVRACAKKLDDAGIWGVDVPVDSTGAPVWPPSVVATAQAAGASTPYTDDPVESLLNAAIMIGGQGYNASGAAVSNGWQFRASAARAQSMVANPSGSEVFPLLVAGMGIHPDPLVWHPNISDAIVADWSNVIVGIRQDVSIQVFTDGVISDQNGKVVLNLMQQDSVAARVTMRVGYRTLSPPTDVDPTLSGLSALSTAAIVAAPTVGAKSPARPAVPSK